MITDTPNGQTNPNVLTNLKLATRNAELARQVAELETECREQARLNGMGSEREARQLARIAELEKREMVLVDVMKKVREELRACQAVIHLDGGFDPLYVSGAQAAMKLAEATIKASPSQTADQVKNRHIELYGFSPLPKESKE